MNGLKKQKALARARLSRANAPRKIRQPLTTKKQFVAAMQNTGGIKYKIAENLNVDRGTVCALLNRPDWADVRELWELELDSTSDLAEDTVRHTIYQRMDLKLASETARWYLSRVKRERYGDETKIVNEGTVAHQHQHVHATIDVNDLNLPIEDRRRLIQAIDEKEQREKDQRLKGEGAKGAIDVSPLSQPSE